ncbi:hypothetical protein [Olleya sp. HaHaR_3_96]|uniref:hypothetical protein n=1 Tax=Olleya sp. HaHaR_3_96 TaxID=2745560 RepID=UPI001C4FB7B6|nr:hypothetical protein [Olleya sp. HaHaR_3_96]QXP61128.1 hypothetical protein H0I26_05710 [Olleya sp. HaHaR_3_96]
MIVFSHTNFYLLDQDHYVCPEGEIILFKAIFNDYKTGSLKKEYRGSTYQCRD